MHQCVGFEDQTETLGVLGLLTQQGTPTLSTVLRAFLQGATMINSVVQSVVKSVVSSIGGVSGGGSGPTPPAGAIKDRSGAYIRDRAGNYIKVR